MSNAFWFNLYNSIYGIATLSEILLLILWNVKYNRNQGCGVIETYPAMILNILIFNVSDRQLKNLIAKISHETNT